MPSGRTPDVGTPRSQPVTVRLSPSELACLEQQKADRRFQTASGYLRFLIADDAPRAKEARDGRQA